VVLLGLSAFFSSSETSLFSLNRIQLTQMREDKNPRVDLIERLLNRPRRLIVTILMGIFPSWPLLKARESVQGLRPVAGQVVDTSPIARR